MFWNSLGEYWFLFFVFMLVLFCLLSLPPMFFGLVLGLLWPFLILCALVARWLFTAWEHSFSLLFDHVSRKHKLFNISIIIYFLLTFPLCIPYFILLMLVYIARRTLQILMYIYRIYKILLFIYLLCATLPFWAVFVFGDLILVSFWHTILRLSAKGFLYDSWIQNLTGRLTLWLTISWVASSALWIPGALGTIFLLFLTETTSSVLAVFGNTWFSLWEIWQQLLTNSVKKTLNLLKPYCFWRCVYRGDNLKTHEEQEDEIFQKQLILIFISLFKLPYYFILRGLSCVSFCLSWP